MRRLLLASLLLSACHERPVDARFASPEATVETLLTAYDLADVPQDEVRARMAAHARFTLLDRETYEACFADLGAASLDEGLAGFVVGALAAGKDELEVEIDGELARVSPREGVAITLRNEDGAWHIVLRDSVPAEIRERIASVAAHADGRLRRGLPTIEN
jgi:hypothetical protein